MKNKNTKTKNSILVKLLFASVVAFTFGFTSCSAVGGFNRNSAAALIEKDNKYKAPATITIAIRKRLTDAGAGTPQLSPDDTAEAAAVRAKDDFATRQPQLLVAEQMGYIKLYFEDGKLYEPGMGEPGYKQNLVWAFKPRAEMTDKGRSLWEKLNLPVNEESLPLAVRGTPEITGLKDENDTMKSADFTYKWETNELGAAFDENSSTFKNLPPNLQQFLKTIKFDLLGQGNNRLMDFNVPRSARAFFQKFDDGWRLGQLYFM